MSEIKLTIDEVIEHCERKVRSYHNSLDMDSFIAQRGLNSNFVKEYLEHKQVAEWLKELKNLRGAMERIIERLKENSNFLLHEMEDSKMYAGNESAIEIVKEEGGIE